MNLRNASRAALVAAGIFGIATVGHAVVQEIEITIAPPANRVEIVPAPRTGYIYEPGHYAYDGEKYEWKQGTFIEERPGHVYTPYAFERRGDKYYLRPGHWDDQP
jgi:hypothetical protein